MLEQKTNVDRLEIAKARQRQALLEQARREKANRQKTLTQKAKDFVRENIIEHKEGMPNVGTLLNMGGESLSLGLVGEEAAARADAFLGRGTYEDRLNFYRQNEKQTREDNPVLSFAAEVAPAMAVPVAGAVSKGPMLARMLRSGGSAAATGGIYGCNE
ncbi:MAG: hypothetical protein AAFX07_03950 [Pseudomonadota bacterium]